MDDKLREEAPKRIYLQWHPEITGSESDCTWCSDKIDENDTEYIRADIIPKHETGKQWEKLREQFEMFNKTRTVNRDMKRHPDGTYKNHNREVAWQYYLKGATRHETIKQWEKRK